MIEKLRNLAKYFDKPLYAVGGFVRDTVLGRAPHDVDIAGDISPEEVFATLAGTEYRASVTNKRLMTLKIENGSESFEYTAFRNDFYTVGHSPFHVERTSDIAVDAMRRDFTMNAVYMDVSTGEFLDPLGGIEDIKNKIVRLTKSSTFEEDGLRLMRLCRQAAEFGFEIEAGTLAAAKENAFRIDEISPERIKDELERILNADSRYGIADAHARGLRLLDEIGVLERILPELTAGKGMEQPPKFHRYDVFNHILETVRFADSRVRLGALMHDIGKPYCKNTFGSYQNHGEVGAEIAEKILKRLRFSNEEIKTVKFLVRYHMFDLKLDEKEETVRAFIQKNRADFELLTLLKTADHKGSGALTGDCPAVIRHKKIYEDMLKENVPFSLSELKVGGNDLIACGIRGEDIGILLNRLLSVCSYDAELTTRAAQMEFILKEYNNAN